MLSITSKTTNEEIKPSTRGLNKKRSKLKNKLLTLKLTTRLYSDMFTLTISLKGNWNYVYYR